MFSYFCLCVEPHYGLIDLKAGHLCITELHQKGVKVGGLILFSKYVFNSYYLHLPHFASKLS